MSDKYPYEGVTFGDYRLVRGLGRGGFADVYLGTDITLEKSVAIKGIFRDFGARPIVELEAHTTKALHEPNSFSLPHAIVGFSTKIGGEPYLLFNLGYPLSPLGPLRTVKYV